MNTPISAVAPDDFEVLMPGWTPEAYVAFVNSPCNRSADRVYQMALKLRAAIRRHLKKHERTDAEIVAAAGVPLPPKLANHGGNHAAFQRFHMRGFLYALTEFTLAVEDWIPEPDLSEPAVVAEGGVPCHS